MFVMMDPMSFWRFILALLFVVGYCSLDDRL